MSSTPKIRLSPSASSASTPPSRMPLIAASTRKIGSINSDAHVRLADEILAGQLRGRALHLDAPDFQEVRAVDQLEHLPHVLLHDEDRVTLLAHPPDQVE